MMATLLITLVLLVIVTAIVVAVLYVDAVRVRPRGARAPRDIGDRADAALTAIAHQEAMTVKALLAAIVSNDEQEGRS